MYLILTRLVGAAPLFKGVGLETLDSKLDHPKTLFLRIHFFPAVLQGCRVHLCGDDPGGGGVPRHEGHPGPAGKDISGECPLLYPCPKSDLGTSADLRQTFTIFSSFHCS